MKIKVYGQGDEQKMYIGCVVKELHLTISFYVMSKGLRSFLQKGLMAFCGVRGDRKQFLSISITLVRLSVVVCECSICS